MSSNLKANIHLLLFLGDSKSDKQQRIELLSTLKDFQVQALTEVILNFLEQNIATDKNTVKSVNKDKEFLRLIGDKDLSIATRKRNLKQSSPSQRKNILKILERSVNILKKL